MEKTELPHDVLGRQDALRQGLSAVKSEVLPLHPVQSLHQESVNFGTASKKRLLENAYGSAFVLKQNFDRQILSRFHRPGNMLPSSMIGLESYTGALDELNFEEIIYDPRDSGRFVPRDMHSDMENRLGLSKGPIDRVI